MLALMVQVAFVFLGVELHHGVLLQDASVGDVRFSVAQIKMIAVEEGKRRAIVGVLEKIAIEEGCRLQGCEGMV
uniref:Putative secreted protein n=1 Tax=Anopheles marajoara TaxID=58244 RepID=A0A2M4CDJ4_9DIPT